MRADDIKQMQELISNMYSFINVMDRQCKAATDKLDALSKQTFEMMEKRSCNEEKAPESLAGRSVGRR